MILPLLAEQTASPVGNWLPVVLLIIVGLGFATVNIAASLIIGPKRTGPGKEMTYESGMVPIGDTRRRFNVRFLHCRDDISGVRCRNRVFLPLGRYFRAPRPKRRGHWQQGWPVLLIEMIVFIAILLVAYFYAWGKGVFRWD